MISVVVPAFNEEEGIRTLYERVTAAAATWNEPYELVVVDDGSRDRTLQICSEIAAGDSRLRVIGLTRNFGHQAALSAGLAYCTGDLVALIDADLQDPPEELARFFAKCREGYDVVYAVRTKRKENWIKRSCYFLYYRLLQRLATIDIPLDSGDFCVMSRPVVDALNALPERSRFLRGLRTWVGYRQTGLSYERHARLAGEPKYNFRRLLKLAFDGVINFSYRPLQVLTFAGVLVGFLAVVAAALFFVQYVTDTTVWGFNPRQSRGWTSLILAQMFFAAVQLFGLGIMGEYLGRLYEEVKHRPVFLVGTLINLERK